MAFEAEFEDLMPHTITVATPAATRDAYGAVTGYGTAASYRARVVHKARVLRSANGDEVVSRTQAWVAGSPGITAQDKVTLPDGTSPPVITVEAFPDEEGAHHEVVYFDAAGSRGAAAGGV